MSDIRLTNALNANAQHESEHANVDASAASDGALHATENGFAHDGGGDASYSSDAASGSVGADATGSASADGVELTPDVTGLPELPTTAEVPELPVDVPAELPELPDPTGSADVAATFEGVLDAMGAVVAEWAASLSAMLGF